MSTDRDINRRDLMVKTAGVASAGALAGASLTPAGTQCRACARDGRAAPCEIRLTRNG